MKTELLKKQEFNFIKEETVGVFDAALTARLLAWYRGCRRALPWRENRDPYRIWISEIMLQQTRVEAVKPYFARFLEAAPTPSALAELEDARLLKLWEGLGYYSRARNLKRAACEIAEKHGGEMPRTFASLLSLPGIGAYTAGAIASIAYDERVPAVDGNVLRVLSRVLASDADIAREDVKRAYAEALLPVIPQDAGDFNQALIEVGATVCVPNGEPKCEVCPFLEACRAHKACKETAFPVKGAKKPRRIEQKTVLLIRDGARTLLGKRPERGLLAGLYELPNAEGHLGEREVQTYVRALGLEPSRIRRIEDAKHIFTHVEWHMIAYDVTVSSEFDGFLPTERLFLAERAEWKRLYAIPSAFSAYTKYL